MKVARHDRLAHLDEQWLSPVRSNWTGLYFAGTFKTPRCQFCTKMSEIRNFVFCQVNVIAFLSGRQDCSQQTILLVNRETSDCSMEIRCQSEKGIPYSSNATLCLVRVSLN